MLFQLHTLAELLTTRSRLLTTKPRRSTQIQAVRMAEWDWKDYYEQWVGKKAAEMRSRRVNHYTGTFRTGPWKDTL